MRSAPMLAALLAAGGLLAAAGPAAAQAPVTRNLTFLANVNQYPPSVPTGDGYSDRKSVV